LEQSIYLLTFSGKTKINKEEKGRSGKREERGNSGDGE